MSDPLNASQRQPEPSSSSTTPRHPLERRTEQPQPPTQPQTRLTPYPFSKPIITYALIAINVLIFVADQYFLGLRLETLGEKSNELILAGEYWRFITPVFLHLNIPHIVMNCLTLFYIGRQVEGLYGSMRFTVIYLLSGISSIVLSFALLPEPSLGASGAIFGLIGALLTFLVRNRSVLNVRQAIQRVMVAIVIQLVFGLVNRTIDNAGHVGGLIGGLALGWFMTPLFKIVPDYTGGAAVKDGSSPSIVWLTAAAGLLVIVGFAQLAVTLYRMGILHLG